MNANKQTAKKEVSFSNAPVSSTLADSAPFKFLAAKRATTAKTPRGVRSSVVESWSQLIKLSFMLG